MAMGINTNLASINTQRNLSSTQSAYNTSIQRLSTGSRVNSAKDDAAGLAIAERMNSQIRGNTVAMRNANDGISFAQTSEGALGQVGEALQRMRELAVQARNETNSASDKTSLDQEYQSLAAEIGRIKENTKFNGSAVFGTGSLEFQIGANTTADNRISLQKGDIDLTGVSGVSIGSAASGVDIDTVIDSIDDAINNINGSRAEFGAVQNRFDSVIATLQVSVENQTAARGRIMDADFASETAELSRTQILQQAGTAMLAQANQSTQNVLSLLR